jgi:cation diffusion facilitator family transporter
VADETRGTVLVALAANVGVAAAKLVAGVATGSAALLSEAAHSVADTLNEVFLLLSLRKSERPADRTHPFGYGKERFFWSLLAAIGIFLSGAGFSAYQGVTAVLDSADAKQPSTVEFLAIYIVLAVSLVLEGTSLRKAFLQVRSEAKSAHRRLIPFVLRSPDPTVKTVASEDSVAVLGVLLALAGTGLHQLTGHEYWDGVSSLSIAALLAYVAYALGRDTKELLIGEAADPLVRVTAYAIVTGHDEIVAVKEMLTMQLGPAAVLVAARVQFADELTAPAIEQVSTDIEMELLDRLPEITQVFLDPSRVTTDDADNTRRRVDLTLEDVRELDCPQSLAELRRPRSRAGRRIAEQGEARQNA